MTLPRKQVTVLGSTGSIGVHTLDVIARHPDKYQVQALSAHQNVDLLFRQCVRFRPEKAVMVDAHCARQLTDRLQAESLAVEVRTGTDSVSEIATECGEIVVCGIVGAAGLLSTLAAVKSGKKVLVANKEPLVMLGQYIVALARNTGACLLPVDSEHNAIFQCLPQQPMVEHNGVVPIPVPGMINRLLLTGSGGPFRTLPIDQFSRVTPQQACAHPNWTMGRKISVDSATMMNKALELIEATVLFGIEHTKIDIVIHPQSLIHSMVEYVDGSIIAQMASPDMKVPIANALAWPDRMASGAANLDFLTASHRLDFEPPDLRRFPALGLAKRAAERQGNLPAIMNAANECAVGAFLEGRITFDRITALVEEAMEQVAFHPEIEVELILETDRETRSFCNQQLRSGRRGYSRPDRQR